ncbi:Hsp70 family protein [Actinoplanes sp. RD1]|uniref:Hsp70 family protein n=1 Tax=Actinoplanes sp. RD1 TaxID=3064538 RepID=UPI0027406A37|nr:Hsp70 family protein [Actinoplanes sp. RD1]
MSIDQGRHALGVDFGTSNTVAVARWPDGRARPILVDGSPLLPSAVYAESSGMLAVGRDAVHSARRDPARFEPNPKRRIDDGTVLLGDREVEVADLIAAVLVRVVEEWHRAVGPVRPDVTLTCPATWGSTRRGLLAEAAARAGLERVRLVAEPVAAATYFADVLGRDVPIGSVVVVHDFGAGTFDASVVARTAEGFEVLAVDGRDDLGGLDIDAALVEHLGEGIAALDAGVWQRLTEPATLEDRRAQRQLWDDARIAKERLSRTQSADVMIPILDTELHVTRDELERLARPILDQTVQVTSDLLRWADLPEGRLAGVFLVGGASRIPLVATLLHRALAEPPVAIEQPELVVAEGSILADAALLASEPAAPGPTSEMRFPLVPHPPAASAAASVSPAAPPYAPAASLPTPAAPPSVPAGPPSAPAGPPSAPAASPSAPARASAASPSSPGFAAAGSSGDHSASSSAGLSAGSSAGLSAGSSGGPSAGSSAGLSAGSSGGPSAGSSTGLSVDNMETVPQSRSGLLNGDGGGGVPPAVDPWPDAEHDWVPDPDATVPSPMSPALLGRTSPPRPDPSYPGVPGAPASPASGTVVPRRFRSGAPATNAPAAAAGRSSTGSVRSSAGGVRPPAGVRQSSPGTPRPAPPAQAGKRRTGRGLRAFQILLSVLVLIAAPILALLVAYSYTSGVDPASAIISLLEDLGDLL